MPKKWIFKRLVCLLTGHIYKLKHNSYSYDGIHLRECDRCSKVQFMEWKR